MTNPVDFLRVSFASRASDLDAEMRPLTMPRSQDNKPEVVTTIEARSGVTGHNVRYVLLFGLGGVIVALALLLMFYSY